MNDDGYVAVAGVLFLLVAGCSSPPGAGSAPDSSVRTRDDIGRPDTGPTPDTTRPNDVGRDTTRTPDTRDTGTHDPLEEPPAPYQLTDEPYTTLQTVWAPIKPSAKTLAKIATPALDVQDIEKYQSNGLGVERQPGRDWAVHDDLAPGFDPQTTPSKRRSLLYYWQVSDPQLVDEESPIRFEGVTATPIGSTYRPSDHLTTQVFEAQVRSARRISRVSGRPFDFVFLAGDATDGGQKNELQWGIEILNGGTVHPDSGADNDPIPGPHNDYTDPFRSRPIGVPWYATIGNHETQYLGALPATDEVQKAAVGDEVYKYTGEVPFLDDVGGLTNGYRDSSTRYAEVRTTGTLPPDRDRRILPLSEVIGAFQRAGGRPDGHGYTRSDVIDEKGYYSFRPIPGKPIRVIVLNTLMRSNAHVQGGIDRRQFRWLKRQLDRAKSRGELVIVGAHHRAGDLARLSPVDAGEFERTLASYENVVLLMVGHGHHNSMKKVSPTDERGYWELMSASLVDFPMQTRIFEFVYEGNGYLSIYATNLGQNSPPGTFAHRARELAAPRKIFLKGSVRGDWKKQQRASNLLLRYELPSKVAQNLEQHAWPTRIESTQTLQQFTPPER